jgi:hypothetical protein
MLCVGSNSKQTAVDKIGLKDIFHTAIQNVHDCEKHEMLCSKKYKDGFSTSVETSDVQE